MRNVTIATTVLVTAFAGGLSYGQEALRDAIDLHIECAAPSVDCIELPMANEPGVMVLVSKTPGMTITMKDVKSAEFTTEEYGTRNQKQLQVRLTEEGTIALAALTKANLEKRMAIVVHNTIVSAPVILMPIAEGNFVLSPGAATSNERMFDQMGWLSKMADKGSAKTEELKVYKLVVYILIGLTLIVGSMIYAFRKEKS